MTDLSPQAQAVKKSADDAYWLWDQMCPADAKIIAVAVLREVVNQLQQSPGVVMCYDILELCDELEAK